MRTTSGSWRVHKDFPNLPAWIVKSVGGSTVHWAGASLRFQEHEFKTRTHYGEIAGANLLDWPITLAEMEPYYAKAEDKMGVTRTNNIPGLPGNNNFKVLEAGAKKLGYKEVHTGRMAINSQPRDGRGACQQIGFCFQGCKSGAKWSTLYAEIPKGEATGKLEVRPDSQVVKIEHDASGKATGVVYADKDGNMQRQKARVVAVAGNSLESPRLLLNSASTMFPDGLANSSGQVGRNYMRHMTASVYGVFDKPVRMWRGTTMAGIVRDEAALDTNRGFVGGYELETLSLGLPFIVAFLDPGAWGRDFTSAIDSYENMAGMWIVGEDMPQETNRVTLDPVAKDKFGMPVASVHFDDHANDVAMRAHAWSRGKAIYEAAGATDVFPTPPYPSTHNLGTNRMSERARDGVVNAHGQTHDIKNLFISDGSQFTSGGAENPTLTIVSLAIRQADYISEQMGKNTI
jgi:choline dehydrogenase-like flavoprotein